LTLSQNRI